ncbi:MAG: hypothetical protein Tsb0014_42160 [Pleurocapsa sp.]
MTVSKSIATGLTVAGIALTTGAIAKKPFLINLGLNLGLSTSIAGAVAKQNKLEKPQFQSECVLNYVDSILFAREIARIEKALKEERIRQKLILDRVSRLDKKQKYTAIALSEQVDKLIELAQDNIVIDRTNQEEELNPTTRVYIDGNNFRASVQSLNLKVNYTALKNILTQESDRAIVKFYDGVSHNINYAQKRLHERLKKLDYQVIALPKVEHKDGTCKTIGDDMQIGTDILSEAKSGDRVILVSGDGDFFPVVNKIKQKGIEVTVLANKNDLSYKLRQVANNYLYLQAIAPQISNTNLSVA